MSSKTRLPWEIDLPAGIKKPMQLHLPLEYELKLQWLNEQRIGSKHGIALEGAMTYIDKLVDKALKEQS